MADPIYLLDFRHGKVVELDSSIEPEAEHDEVEEQASGPSQKITFAALGSPVESKD